MHINSVDGKGNNKLEYKSSLNYLTNHTRSKSHYWLFRVDIQTHILTLRTKMKTTNLSKSAQAMQLQIYCNGNVIHCDDNE